MSSIHFNDSVFTQSCTRVALVLGDARGGTPGSSAHLRWKGKGEKWNSGVQVLVLAVNANTHQMATHLHPRAYGIPRWDELEAGGVAGRKT